MATHLRFQLAKKGTIKLGIAQLLINKKGDHKSRLSQAGCKESGTPYCKVFAKVYIQMVAHKFGYLSSKISNAEPGPVGSQDCNRNERAVTQIRVRH